LRVKEATPRDRTGMERIFKEVFGRSGARYYGTRWDIEARRCVEQYYTLGAKTGNEVVGFVSARFFQPHSLFFPFKLKRGKGKVSFIVDWLVVAPGFQNRGVGSLLMKEMLSKLSTLTREYPAFSKAIVLVRASNWWEFRRGRRRVIPVARDSPAVKFYRKFGFKYRRGWMRLVL